MCLNNGWDEQQLTSVPSCLRASANNRPDVTILVPANTNIGLINLSSTNLVSWNQKFMPTGEHRGRGIFRKIIKTSILKKKKKIK